MVAEEAVVLLSLLWAANASTRTLSVWPVRVCRHSSVSASHTRTVWSLDADARRRRSGDILSARTASRCALCRGWVAVRSRSCGSSMQSIIS
jgi:hypothetical protein